MNMTVFIIVLMIGGILYLTSTSVSKKDMRERHLKALTDLLEGDLHEIEYRENSFEISFEYRGGSFVFQDIEDITHAGMKVHRGYLRLTSPLPITVSFTERSRKAFQTGQTALAVEDLGDSATDQIMIPAVFKEFSIYSNNVRLANQLMEDENVVRVFSKYKNKDSRGKPLLTMELADGVVIVRFSPQGEFQPAMFDLRHNVGAIEDFLEDILIVGRSLQRISEREKEHM